MTLLESVRRAVGRTGGRLPHIRKATAVAALLYIAAAAVFGISIRQFSHRRTGFTYLINFGDQFYGNVLPAVRAVPHFTFPGAGYDGQWYAQLAFEPLLRDRAIDKALDTPPYRARRILFAWTAYVGGLGQPRMILKAYALQNIIAWVVLAVLMLRWFPPTAPRHFLPWFGCLFGAGLSLSIRNALLEGPSMMVMALAILAIERNRSVLGSCVMGLAGLGRETNLLGSGMLVEELPKTPRQVLKTGGALLMAIGPFVLWSLYVRSVYPDFNYSNPASFGVPFSGYAKTWVETISELRAGGWNSYARFTLVALVSLTTQAAYLLARRDWKSPWWRMGVVYAVFMPLLSPLVWEGYPGAAVRVLLPMSFAFNVLVVKDRWFWPLVILGNVSVLDGVAELRPPLLSPYL